MSDKRLFLLDGHALVYRAHFAFINRPLINSKGFNTSAITGFTRTLWDLMKNQQPTHLAVAFDPSGPTFRHEMMESYKANREEQPDDIRASFPYIHQILQAFKIPIIVVDNYEADDVIGTLAKQAEKEGYQVYMVTPDKDYGQLVSENIFMYKPSRQGDGIEILGVPEICEKWDIDSVDQVIDMLGMQGDAVDNIPGIPGIGPKTAAKLLKTFGSLENLLENTDQLKGKQKEKVEENRDLAILSKQLARIKLDVPIQFNADDYVLDPFDREWLSEIFKELEFRGLANSILGQEEEKPMAGQQGSLFATEAFVSPDSGLAKHDIATKNIATTEHHYHLVATVAEQEGLLAKLLKAATVCFDTETTSVNANEAELVGMSFAVEVGTAWYVPVPADQKKAQEIVERFRPLFEAENIAKIGQNIKYDMLILRWYQVEVKGALLDTMVMHYLLEPERRHNMDYLAETMLEYKPVSITELIGKAGKNQKTMRSVPVEQVVDYACEDADITLQLHQALAPQLAEEPKIEELYHKIEGPLVRTLAEIEFEGIKVDADFLAAYSEELAHEIVALEDQIQKEAGVPFNLASPKQVGEVLFEHMKIPYRWKKTKSGQHSTDEEKMSEIAENYPIAADILRHRGLTKLRSTYLDSLPKLINPKTGRIHSSFNQTVAATGRLSSKDPNLQNIPIRTEEGRKVRKAFVPRDKDHILVAADYSQIELRLIAEISGDEAMLEAFQSGRDIHRATAARVFDTPYEEVDREQRGKAKTVNFAIIYGAGSQNLSQQLGISRGEAKELIDTYFDRYPGLKRYMEDTVKFARENGFVTTLLGRRRQLRDINSKSSLARSNAERMAINTPIQGTAADMIKLAMLNVQAALKAQGFQSKMILQVHDELVFDVRRDELERIKPVIEENMKNALPGLKVPILVEIGTGENWLEAH
ncbi:DNA polymerase I [Lewinella sp. LCG006]|uniref:DNA polymerase I n=1 Tax=Lewinella sp. LCG006 TaxID=3231911 RepID=UPI0034607632